MMGEASRASVIDLDGYAEDSIHHWLHGVAESGIEVELVGNVSIAYAPSASGAPDIASRPQTPLRSLQRPISTGPEPSPTNTNFTDQSIFDKPEEVSSTPDLDDDDDAGSVSSVEAPTTVFHYKDYHQDKKALLVGSPSVNSLNSIEPPSDLEEEERVVQAPIRIPASPDPGKPHLVWMVSCLQCTLANLPCSRTLPSCSRCVRNGFGALCLTQRKRFYEESRGGFTGCYDPVLLRLAEEDQEVWDSKVQLHGLVSEICCSLLDFELY